MTEEGVVTKLT